ncbi:hypothetical protein BH09SUM1_BH09SUM1_04780 [soil metagenome]
MQNKLIAAVIAATVALGVGIQFASRANAQAPAAATAGAKSTGGVQKTIASADAVSRGLTKSVYMYSNSHSGNATYTFKAKDEIDLRSITVDCRIDSGSKAYTSNIYLRYAGSTGLSVYPVNLTITGEGTTHLTFDPPIPVRAADEITISGAAVTTQTIAFEVSLNGSDPATKATGFVTQ